MLDAHSPLAAPLTGASNNCTIIGTTSATSREGTRAYHLACATGGRPELHLRSDVLIPDVAGWRTARLPSLPKTPYIAVAPDWVCEILSPSTQSLDRYTKLPAYAAADVSTVWLISTLTRALEVFRLRKASYQLIATHTGEVRVRVEPFEELRLDLAALWS